MWVAVAATGKPFDKLSAGNLEMFPGKSPT
jgi:hypothetical protein